jgi:hypothetical protein
LTDTFTAVPAASSRSSAVIKVIPLSTLVDLEELLASVRLTAEDERSSVFETRNNVLSSALIYKASTHSGSLTPGFQFVWRSYVPPKVKFFYGCSYRVDSSAAPTSSVKAS